MRSRAVSLGSSNVAVEVGWGSGVMAAMGGWVGSSVGGWSVAVAHKASNIVLQFITEGKLDVVTVVPRPFWIVSFRVALFE